MTPIRAKTIWTLLIAFAVTLSLPFSAYFVFTRLMAPRITRYNTNDVFDEFQAVLDQGKSVIHDGGTAALVAERAARDKMQGPPVDGWSNQMRISAAVHGNTCELKVLSAGPDGAFGTADDILMKRSFDLSRPKAKSP